MAHHPPLYYILSALLTSWSDITDFHTALVPNPHFTWAGDHSKVGWNVFLHTSAESFPYKGTILTIHYLRLWSVLMGMVTVLSIYRIGRLVLPGQPWIAITAAALIAFNPSFLFMSSTVHHDPLMAMIYALSLWWMVRALGQRPTVQDALIGGVLLGAGLLTKLSALSLILLYALTLLLAAWGEGDRCWRASKERFHPRVRALERVFGDWRWGLRCGVSLYGVALVIAGWWYVRNQVLYDDPLGWQMYLSVYHDEVRHDPYTWFLFYHEFLGFLFRTAWGAFGYVHIILPPAINRFFWSLTGISALAALAVGIRHRRVLLANGRWRPWLVLLGALVLVFISFVRFATQIRGVGHARHLFTIAGPFSLILSVGLNALARFRAQRLVASMVGVGMLIYAVIVPLRFVLPLYAPPETAQPSDLGSATQSGVVFGDALELVAYAWEPEAVPPGQKASLALYWRGVEPERPDLFVRLRLRDRFGNALVEDAFWPAPSSSTIVWDTSTVYVTRRTLDIPPNAATGPSPLEILVQPGRDGNALPARTVAGEALGATPTVASLLVGQANVATLAEMAASHPRGEVLNGTIALLGYDLTSERVRPGETIELTLYWQTAEALDRNFTVFVHVVNEQAQLVAQQDNEPNAGQYPTSAWVPGEIIRDPHAIALPADLPSGRYSLLIGMYEWPSLQRLPVTVAGIEQGDTIMLGDILVE